MKTMCQLKEVNLWQVTSTNFCSIASYKDFQISVLNKEDPDWYWIVRTDGQEGFVPSAFVYPAENILQTQDPIGPVNSANNNNSSSAVLNNNGATGGNLMSLSNNNAQVNSNPNFLPASNLNNQQCQMQSLPHEPAQQMLPNVQDDSRYHGTELVMLYDYKAQAPDDLSVRRGKFDSVISHQLISK